MFVFIYIFIFKDNNSSFYLVVMTACLSIFVFKKYWWFYVIKLILSFTIVKRPSTIIWMRHYIKIYDIIKTLPFYILYAANRHVNYPKYWRHGHRGKLTATLCRRHARIPRPQMHSPSTRWRTNRTSTSVPTGSSPLIAPMRAMWTFRLDVARPLLTSSE